MRRDRSARSKRARKTDWSFVACFRSRVGRKTVKARAAVKVAASSDLKFDDDWKKSSVPVHLASLFGWVIPSASPCPAFENNASLFQVFSDRIGANLANFPQGPAADDKIWFCSRFISSRALGLWCAEVTAIRFLGARRTS